MLRAFAALSIALRHCLADADALATGVSDRPVYPFDQLSSGVDLFFVISGFVMVYASQGLFGAEGASATFLFKRWTRVVPLYWITTTLFLLVEWMRPESINSAAVNLDLILGSYFFIPVMRPDGTIWPVYSLGWTLNYEMLFYFILAAAIVLKRPEAIFATICTLLALVLFGAAFQPAGGAARFWTNSILLEFAFGMLIAQGYISGLRFNRVVAAALGAAGLALLALDSTRSTNTFWHLRFIAWGLPAALIVFSAVLIEPKQQKRDPTRVGEFLMMLGDASYALYLVHPFAMRGLKLLWSSLALTTPVALGAYVVATIATSTLLALLVHWFIERPILKAVRGYPRVAPTS